MSISICTFIVHALTVISTTGWYSAGETSGRFPTGGTKVDVLSAATRSLIPRPDTQAVYFTLP